MQNHPPPPQDDGYPTNPPWTMFFDGPLYARYEEFMRGKDFSKILLQSKLKLANLHTSTESASMSSTSKDHDFWEFEPDTDPRPTKYPAGSDMYQCETDEYFRQIEEEEKRRTRRTRACIWLTIVIMAALAFGTALVIHYFFIPSREDPKSNVNISLSGNTTMFAAGTTTPKVSSKDLSSEISRVLNVLKKEVMKDAKRGGTSTANASTDGSLSTTPLDPLDFFGIDIYDSTTGSFLSSPLEVITSSGTETTRAPPAASRVTKAPKSGSTKNTKGRATKASNGGKAGVTSSPGVKTTSKPADIVTDTTEQEKTKKILKAGPKVATKKVKGTILKQNVNKGATTKAPPAVKAKPQIKGTKKVLTPTTTVASTTIVTTAAPTTAVPTTKAATTNAPTKAATTKAPTTQAPPVETTEDYEYWYYTDDTTTHVPTPAVQTNQPTTKVATTSTKAATPTLGQTSASTASTKPTQQISSTILAKLTTLLTVPVRSTLQPKANSTTVSAKTLATTAATTIKLPASSSKST